MVLQTNFREALTLMMMMMILVCYLVVYVVKRLRIVTGQGTVTLLIHFMLSIIIIMSKKLGTESRNRRGIWRGFISKTERVSEMEKKFDFPAKCMCGYKTPRRYPRVITRSMSRGWSVTVRTLTEQYPAVRSHPSASA